KGMHMRKQILTSLALTSLMATLASAQSSTNEFSRAGNWEVHGFGQYVHIEETGIFGFESNTHIWGGGVGVGYNVLDHLTVNGDFSINSLKTDISWGSFSVDGVNLWNAGKASATTTLYLGTVSLDYNILKTRLT